MLYTGLYIRRCLPVYIYLPLTRFFILFSILFCSVDTCLPSIINIFSVLFCSVPLAHRMFRSIQVRAAEASGPPPPSLLDIDAEAWRKPPPITTQLSALLRRSALNVARDPYLAGLHLLLTLCVGLVVGSLFKDLWRLNGSTAGVQVRYAGRREGGREGGGEGWEGGSCVATVPTLRDMFRTHTSVRGWVLEIGLVG